MAPGSDPPRPSSCAAPGAPERVQPPASAVTPRTASLASTDQTPGAEPCLCRWKQQEGAGTLAACACTPASFPEAPRGEQNWPRPPSNHHTLGWEPPSPAPHASRRQSSGREAEAAAAGGPTQLPRALLPWGHCAPRCPQPDLGRPFAPGTTTGRVRWRPGPVGGACGLTPAQQWERSRAVRPWAGPSQPEKTCQTPALPAPNQTGRGPLAPAPRVRRKAYLTASSLLFCRMSSMNSWILRLNSRQL